MTRAHLIRHGADTTDPSGDVGRFGELASSEQAFKKPRGLKDTELDLRYHAVVNANIQAALAVDTCEVVDLHRPRPAWW